MNPQNILARSEQEFQSPVWIQDDVYHKIQYIGGKSLKENNKASNKELEVIFEVLLQNVCVYNKLKIDLMSQKPTSCYKYKQKTTSCHKLFWVMS